MDIKLYELNENITDLTIKLSLESNLMIDLRKITTQIAPTLEYFSHLIFPVLVPDTKRKVNHSFRQLPHATMHKLLRQMAADDYLIVNPVIMSDKDRHTLTRTDIQEQSQDSFMSNGP